jgi:hypothetical protein
LNRFGLPKETAAYINKILPIGTAEAAPQAAPPTPAGQIPGAAPGVTAPQAAPAQPEGSFSKLGKGVASLLDVATSPAPWLIKQVGYAASRPFMSPAEAEKLSSETAAPFQDIIGKTAGITQDPTYQNEASRRLAGFIGENLNKGSKWIANKLGIPEEDAANMVNTVAAAGPKAVSGIRQLPAAAEQLYSRVRPEPGKLTPQQINALAAEKRAAALEEARRDAMAAGATLEEQTALANMVEQRQQREAPSAAYELQQSAARPAPGRIATIGGKSAEQVKQAVPFARPDEGAAGLQNVPGAYNYMSPEAQATKTALRQYEIGQVGAGAPKSDVAAAAQAVDVAKQALPPEKRKGMGWEDLMMFGFALMAGKSPYAMQNIGTAGLAALQGKQEREKAEREERQTAGKQALEAAQAKYYEQYAGAIERGAKEKNDLLAAETLVQKRVGEWEKSLEGKMAAMQNPNARAQIEDALRRQIYGQLGLDVSKIAGAPATGDTGGFKVVGVRNP